MIVRVLPVATVSLFCFWGCSQGGAPIPNGPGQPTAADVAERGRPGQVKLEYFDTPSKAAWPLYITAGPQGTLWFSEAFTDIIGRITTDGTITEFPISNARA
jgi:streptogramin lyase